MLKDEEVWIRAYCAVMVGEYPDDRSDWAERHANKALDLFRKRFPTPTETDHRISTRALLVSEKASHHGRCPSCHQVVDDLGHAPACAHDEALIVWGYPDRAARDKAYSEIMQEKEPTT